MLRICQRYACHVPGICLAYALVMPGISQGYAWDMPGICQGYARDMLKKYPLNAKNKVLILTPVAFGDTFYEHCLVSIEKDPLLHVKEEHMSDMEAEVDEPLDGGQEEAGHLELMLDQHVVLEEQTLDLSDGTPDISYRWERSR